jgi:carbamoyltransferase
MIVLGLHFGHGAAAALVADGRVVAAIEEEKLNRIKGYVGFPFQAMEFVLECGDVSLDEVNYVALGVVDVAEFSSNFAHLIRVVFRCDGVWTKVVGYALDFLQSTFYKWDSSKALERLFFYYLQKKANIPKSKVIKVDHHTAHAASAFYTAPWRSAVVLTADGKGDGACGGAFAADSDGLKLLDRVSDRFSVGQFYQAVTRFLGYKVNRHEGKITGMAAHGDCARVLPLMEEILGFDKRGAMRNALYDRHPGIDGDPVRYYEREDIRKSWLSARYIRLLNGNLRKFGIAHQLYQNFLADNLQGTSSENLAAGIQRLAEDMLERYARQQLKEHLPCNVCLAGGVFANVKINQRIREIEGVEGFYVQPAIDDAGCALGAALHVAAGQGGKGLKRPVMASVYGGPGYSEEELATSLDACGLPYRRPADPAVAVAELLHAGEVVGRFAGRLEWGPRALGNRSILARPTDAAINDILNRRLRRTEFMPFAPAILAESARDYLVGYRDGDSAARHMTVTYAIEPARAGDIAAAVHVDGTARPQVVFSDDNPEFYRIIEAYRGLSGIPAVINTSFNMHEEPIVATPDDALRALQADAVDVLSMGPFLVGPID